MYVKGRVKQTMKSIEAAHSFMKVLLAATPQNVTLSTMTIVVTLNRAVSLTKVKDGLHLQSMFFTEVIGSPNYVILRKPSNGKCFNNCLIFDIEVPRLTMKVFCNGTLHITGVKSTASAYEISEIFVTLFELIYEGSGLTNMFMITKMEVELMNHHYKLPLMVNEMVIDLELLRTRLTEKSKYYVSYNSEHHAGVIIKAPNFTIIIFESGNIIFTSIKFPAQLQEAFGFVDEFMSAEIAKLLVPKLPAMKKAKRGRPVKENGFDYGKYLVLR